MKIAPNPTMSYRDPAVVPKVRVTEFGPTICGFPLPPSTPLRDEDKPQPECNEYYNTSSAVGGQRTVWGIWAYFRGKGLPVRVVEGGFNLSGAYNCCAGNILSSSRVDIRQPTLTPVNTDYDNISANYLSGYGNEYNKYGHKQRLIDALSVKEFLADPSTLPSLNEFLGKDEISDTDAALFMWDSLRHALLVRSGSFIHAFDVRRWDDGGHGGTPTYFINNGINKMFEVTLPHAQREPLNWYPRERKWMFDAHVYTRKDGPLKLPDLSMMDLDRRIAYEEGLKVPTHLRTLSAKFVVRGDNDKHHHILASYDYPGDIGPKLMDQKKWVAFYNKMLHPKVQALFPTKWMYN